MAGEQPLSLYDRVRRFIPGPIRKVGRRVAARVPLPLLYGRGFRQAWRELRATERLDAERLRALADAKLRRLVTHAYENVPYYRELFDREGLDPGEIAGTADLPKIPLLSKQILRERFEDLKARDFRRHRPRLCLTGGSTGERTRYFLSQRAIDAERAAYWRHYHQVGYRFGDRCAAIYLPLEGDAADLPFFDNWRTHQRELNTRFLTRERLRAFVDAIVAYRADVIWTYPSHLALLCRYVEETGDMRLHPRVVITNSEVLYDEQRAAARRVLGCDVFDWYGLGEHVAAAGECEHHGYHIPEEVVAVEVLAGAGEAPAGERGEIVGTSLENYAQPLIRYRTGDYAIRRAEPCPCGRAHALLAEIGGRTQDIITTPSGIRTFRHGACAFEEVLGLEAVQIEQVTLDRFIVRAVAPQGLAPGAQSQIAAMVEAAVGFAAHIEVVLVPEIPRTARGKAQLVISRVPFSFIAEAGRSEGERLVAS
jgi:phenylacetate-CoA ligase